MTYGENRKASANEWAGDGADPPPLPQLGERYLHDDYVVTMITDGLRPTRYVDSISPGQVPNVARMSRRVFIERGPLQ